MRKRNVTHTISCLCITSLKYSSVWAYSKLVGFPRNNIAQGIRAQCVGGTRRTYPGLTQAERSQVVKTKGNLGTWIPAWRDGGSVHRYSSVAVSQAPTFWGTPLLRPGGWGYLWLAKTTHRMIRICLTIASFFLFLVTTLLSSNSHNLQFTPLRCTIQYFLIYSQSHSDHHNQL